MGKKLTKIEALEAQVHYCAGMAEQHIAQAKKDARRIRVLEAKLKKLHLAAMALGSSPNDPLGEINGIFDKVNSSLYSMIETDIDENGKLCDPVLACIVCGSLESSHSHQPICPVGILEEYVRNETSEDF